MKKLVFILAFLFCMNLAAPIVPINQIALGAEVLSGKIDQIEKAYFGYTYPKESDATRLDRLEKAIYGETSKAAANQRVQKLFGDIQADITPEKGKKFADATGGAAPVEEELPPAEKDVKYPIVDKVEKKVLNKTYENEDIYKRLARLEKQLYKKEGSGSLNDRVDKLRMSVLGNEPLVTPTDDNIIVRKRSKSGPSVYYVEDGSGQWQNTAVGDEYDYNDSQYNYYTPQNTKNRIARGSRGYNSDSQNFDLDSLERDVLRKRYSGEPSSVRLARLEQRVFQRTFSDDDDDARIQRLMAATTAQKTSGKYDSNAFMQKFAAGMQVGGIILMILAMIL